MIRAYNIWSGRYKDRNEGKEHDIFIAGGTSIALEFEDNFIKISDPQMATAQGAYYVATMLFE